MSIKVEVAFCHSLRSDTVSTANEFLSLDLPTNSIDLASSYPPFICNSPSIACRSTMLLALISRLLLWPSKAAHTEPVSDLHVLTSHLLLQSTPLHLAAGYNRVRIVQLLLQHGADVHAKDKG